MNKVNKDDRIQKSILTLPEGIQEHVKEAVDRFSRIPTLTEDEVVDFATFMVDVTQNKHLLDLIRQINLVSPEDMKKIFQIVSDWSIVDAICLSIVIKGRVKIIEKFEKLLNEEAKEKPDMHELLESSLAY